MLERTFGLALLAVLGGLLAVLAILWRIVDRVGEARIYSDLTTWAMMLTLIIGGIVFARVLLTGLTKLSLGRNAHKKPIGTNTVVRETRIMDGRTPQAPQILTLPSAMDAYPASFVSEASQQRAQIAAPQGSGWAVADEAWPDVGWAELPHAGVVAAAYAPAERSNGQGAAW